MPSSSMSEPCSIDRTPARMATLMPSVPWAWAATNTPWRAASSTAASTIGVSSSTNPGSVPRVRTAPVTISLMTVGAAADERADPLAHLGRRADDAEAQVRRERDVAGQAGDVAAAARAT